MFDYFSMDVDTSHVHTNFLEDKIMTLKRDIKIVRRSKGKLEEKLIELQMENQSLKIMMREETMEGEGVVITEVSQSLNAFGGLWC